MSASEHGVGGRSHSPLEAFGGPITQTKTRLLYRSGLAIVAFAMVLLPLIYLALIALAAWAIYWHVTRDTWILSDQSGLAAVFRLLLYLGPVLAGGILMFFMVKPLLARKTASVEALALEAAKEPVLVGCIAKICGLVGAAVPSRIDLDCQVNASASLRRGFWSKDLVLTIGLPLVAGLNMREFVGVLAHEFGHFAQGGGLRLTYIIRHINLWFARLVFERDAWDLKLERAARSADVRIAVVLHAAQSCIWLTRRILWALMRAGQAISCFLLRQMEYDADRYEAKIAGSDVFADTAVRLRQLSVAAQLSFEDLRQSWAAQRMAANVPEFVEQRSAWLPSAVQQQLATAAATAKTGWFDTHPCDADRQRAVERVNAHGVFRLTEPASRLFANFDELCRTVTRHLYEKQFGLEVAEQNLVSTEEMVRESLDRALVRKYYGNVNAGLLPLLTSGELAAEFALAKALPQWRAARQATEELRPAAEENSFECLETQRRLDRLASAQALASVGFQFEPKEFGLPEQATSPGEQEIAARLAMEEVSAALGNRLRDLDPFMAALRRRVLLALRLGQGSRSVWTSDAAVEVTQLTPLLAVVGAEMGELRELNSKLNAWWLLAQNRGQHPDPAQLDTSLAQLAAEVQRVIDGLQERLRQFPYPFPHAHGRITVASYARWDGPVQNDLHRAHCDGAAHVERLFLLNLRLIGCLLARVDAVETALEQHPADIGPA